MLRVGVLVSGAGSNLQALIDGRDGRDYEIVGVVSSHAGVPALARAERAGIATAVFALPAGGERELRDSAMADWLAERNVDLVVCAGFAYLLRQCFLDRFPGRVINVHPSLLPAFPGLQAIEQALAAGVQETGVTVFVVDTGVDTGNVLSQERVPVRYDDSQETLRERIHAVEHRLLPATVRAIAQGRTVEVGGRG